MKISIVIPAYNEEKYIARTLESIVKNATAELLEIIVVDNACTDKTARVALAFPKVRVVDEPEKGLTRARQAGLAAASGEILAYLDADTLVDKHWFEILIQQFQNDDRLVCLSGPYRYYGHNPSGSRLVNVWYAFWIRIWHWFIDRISNTEKGYVIMGGNFAAKKDALIKAGGFNTKIEFYGEDTDIARRLHLVGKVKFANEFWVKTSARRFNKEGLIRTAIRYLLNYLSVVVLKRPLTSKYSDIR